MPAEKIEWWHHLIDGREGSRLMDWPVTEGYIRKAAETFGVRLYFSWKEGGFEGEMLRNNQPTRPTWFETPEGLKKAGGESGNPGTRRRFPQVSADLRVRWCSAYLKIDVSHRALVHQDRFRGKRTLTVSGKRAEESPPGPTTARLNPTGPTRAAAASNGGWAAGARCTAGPRRRFGTPLNGTAWCPTPPTGSASAV